MTNRRPRAGSGVRLPEIEKRAEHRKETELIARELFPGLRATVDRLDALVVRVATFDMGLPIPISDLIRARRLGRCSQVPREFDGQEIAEIEQYSRNPRPREKLKNVDLLG